jgi:hypothetical protein
VIAVENDWELSLGFYGGLVIGFRHYPQNNCTDYVLYLPLIDICLTIYND